MSQRPPDHQGLFVGRRTVLDRLSAEFADGARLVTIVGAAGIGKTRLALRFADQGPGRWRRDSQASVLTVALETGRSDEDVVAAVAAAAGVATRASDDLDRWAEAVGGALAGRGPTLLVLDNLEQVLEPAARQIGGWLSAAPRLAVLTTSREALRIAEEVVLPLAPLTVPATNEDPAGSEAVTLFLERARALRPDLSPGDDELQTVAAVVRRLDGIPLAIELAAARTSVLSPAAILERLDAPLALLRGRRRDQGARQATLEGALVWSWDLLDDGERDALTQLSVFRGPFDLEAAEAVLQVEPAGEAMELLQSLVERSLVRAERDVEGTGAARFSQFMVIRAFADARLDGSRREHALARHASYHLHSLPRSAGRPAAGGPREAVPSAHRGRRAGPRGGYARRTGLGPRGSGGAAPPAHESGTLAPVRGVAPACPTGWTAECCAIPVELAPRRVAPGARCPRRRWRAGARRGQGVSAKAR